MNIKINCKPKIIIFKEDDKNFESYPNEHADEIVKIINEYEESIKYRANLENEISKLWIERATLRGLNRELVQINEIYRKHFTELTDRMLAEFEKDGCCRLVIQKEEAKRMKAWLDSQEKVKGIE